MTVSTTGSVASYIESAAAGYPVPFRFLSASDLIVKRRINGVETTLALGSDYSVSGADAEAGGLVTRTIAAAIGAELIIQRVTPRVQPTDYVANDRFPAESHERALDRGILITQEDGETASRSIQFPVGEAPTTSGSTLPSPLSRASRLLAFTAGGVLAMSSFTTAQLQEAVTAGFNASVQQLSGNIFYTRDADGAIGIDLNSYLSNFRAVNAFEWLTAGEIIDVITYTGAIDLTAKMNKAITEAAARNRDVFFPAGKWRNTGITASLTTANRAKHIRIFGQGIGNPFAVTDNGGTIFKSTSDAPVFTDMPITGANSNGGYEIFDIRFDGTSSSYPVVLLNTMYGTSSFHHCVMYQRGTAGGFKLLYGATGKVHDCYAFNRDYVTFGLGAARVGTGFEYVNAAASGLITWDKISSRGFLLAYNIEAPTSNAAVYSFKLSNFECSNNYNGVRIGANVNKAVLDGGYFEGGDGGTAIDLRSGYYTVRDCAIYSGYLTGIDDTQGGGTGVPGGKIEDVVINMGAKVNATHISLLSSGGFGGPSKVVINPTLIYTAGTAGVSGIKIAGTDPRIHLIGPSYNPRTGWTGAGTKKINDTTASGMFGLTVAIDGDYEMPFVSRGMFASQPSFNPVTQAALSGTVLTIPQSGNVRVAPSASGYTANELALSYTPLVPGTEVELDCTNGNITFNTSNYLRLNGGVDFTGPGILTLRIYNSGGRVLAKEKCRSNLLL
ncbi:MULTISPECIES: hypothetical protein [unclassified Sphingomonas]|uniref:hypothetical protein n=1 Tax=unclassified Sphingomonas TaxID=196159 RepID=UPI000700CB45|nr:MULTISPECIES: hypothetical protein [unclassified Sphingomonas]KQX19330.1 hypothetical protein ASD17_12365 [Sphingomonas sp. Root1294]KQY65533.1 hypothetical protein ASD39_15565 [Sphingomonas sp. Root50]KRB95167.1 hypothetical protein ASE22_04495 [Sphingomonas sp. Root720]